MRCFVAITERAGGGRRSAGAVRCRSPGVPKWRQRHAAACSGAGGRQAGPPVRASGAPQPRGGQECEVAVEGGECDRDDLGSAAAAAAAASRPPPLLPLEPECDAAQAQAKTHHF